VKSIGKLKRLGSSEVRKIWPREQEDLTPWIAENVDALNEALGLEIEVETAEEYVHGFRLDLAGTDTRSQVPVIVENQFGRSNHDHLGKLITYSAAKEAGIVIWIANEIHTGHREAIDWLNTITPQEMTFYAVELEVFQIDDSLPAPNFRVVTAPPPSKGPPGPSDAVTPRNRRYQEFFDKLRDALLSVDPHFTRAKAPPQSWWGLPVGRSGFSLTPNFTIEGKFRIEVYIDTGSKKQNDSAFDQLRESRALLEAGIGEELVWEPLPDKRASRIYVAADGTIDDDEDHLDELVEWATRTLVKFRDVFRPLIKNLDLEV
jgi:hypothetical protein